MKKYVKYKRVSSRGQVDQFGLDVQDELITSYAEANGYQLADPSDQFIENAVSGTTEFDDREAWVAMLEYITAAQTPITVIVSDLSRLARDLMVQETLLADLRKRGIDVISVREPDLCSDDPSRKLIRQVIGAINEYDRAMITAQLKRGRIARAKTGERGVGGIPLGYTTTVVSGRKQTVIDKDESEIVGLVKQMRDIGKMSHQAIADRLNELEIRPKKWARENPTKFHGSTIGKILKRRLYDGITSMAVDSETTINGVNESLRIS